MGGALDQSHPCHVPGGGGGVQGCIYMCVCVCVCSMYMCTYQHNTHTHTSMACSRFPVDVLKQ